VPLWQNQNRFSPKLQGQCGPRWTASSFNFSRLKFMGVPKRKMSKMRLRTRKAANRWHAPKLARCGKCGAATRSHCACASCGYYHDRQVLTVAGL
jgi:large subunit ribosomal protein L32